MFHLDATVNSADELRATANYLNALADIRSRGVKDRTVIGGTISREDNPATGAPEAPLVPVPPKLAAASAVFGMAPDPAKVFGAAPAAPFVADASSPFAATASVPSVPLPPPPMNDAALTVAPPVASPVSAAPTVPVAAPPAGGVDVDATGLPWDGRIHGSTKTKNADGTWRQRRGLNDAALKARVEAELRAAQAAPAPVVAAVPVPPASVVPPPPIAAAATAPAAPAAPTTQAPAAAGDVAVASLPALMAQVAPLMAAQRLSMPKMLECCQAVGVPSLAVLGTRPDLVPAVWQQVQTFLAAPAA